MFDQISLDPEEFKEYSDQINEILRPEANIVRDFIESEYKITLNKDQKIKSTALLFLINKHLENFGLNITFNKMGKYLTDIGLMKKRFNDGLFKEVKKLRKTGLSFNRLHELGLEYRLMGEFLQGKISEEDMKERMIIENIKYAKRQMTWFKRNKDIKWLSAKDILSLI